MQVPPSPSPTVSFAPTKPTENPSLSPTISFSPTISHSPTDKPTESSKPTWVLGSLICITNGGKKWTVFLVQSLANRISPKPTFAPSVSIAPTNPPTGVSQRYSHIKTWPTFLVLSVIFLLSLQSPTYSFSPSETPSTASPTYTPTAKPTRRPTRLPTPRPTRWVWYESPHLHIYFAFIDFILCYILNRPPSDVTEPPTNAAAEATSVDRAVTSSSMMKTTLTTSLVGFAAAVWFLVW